MLFRKYKHQQERFQQFFVRSLLLRRRQMQIIPLSKHLTRGECCCWTHCQCRTRFRSNCYRRFSEIVLQHVVSLPCSKSAQNILPLDTFLSSIDIGYDYSLLDQFETRITSPGLNFMILLSVSQRE